jgi:hypothetical protein
MRKSLSAVGLLESISVIAATKRHRGTTSKVSAGTSITKASGQWIRRFCIDIRDRKKIACANDGMYLRSAVSARLLVMAPRAP